MSEVILELTEEEFVVIMSALEYVSNCSEIRTLYTEGSKSSALTGRAYDMYYELSEEGFDELYARYLDKYYAAEEY